VQHFILPIRVYYEDTDSSGVVYYANYLKFMERARTEFLRALGYEQDVLIRDQGVLFAVRSITIEYNKPARFNDLLHVSVNCVQSGRVRISFAQTVTRPRDDGENDILTTGIIKVASLDAITFKPKPIPRNLRQDLDSAR
jgi:acyl-CoA thioester hydrolase